MNYIIDGYNLAYNITDIASLLKKGNPEAAVRQLIRILNTTIKNNTAKIILVLDGNPFASEKINSAGRIKILFSKKPQIADDIIRDFVRKTKNIDRWTVVSSDSEILFTAIDHGAKTIKSADFLKKTDKPDKPEETDIDLKSNPQNIDIDYWKDIFNSGNDK